MAFTHGVYTQEVPTSLLSPIETSTGLPVVIGTAPIHLGDITNINKPQLIHTYAEAVKLFGYSDDWEKYTLCEFIYSQFALFGVSPCVLINVLDPAKHSHTVKKLVSLTENKEIALPEALIENFEAANSNIDDSDEEEATGKIIYVKNTDYSLSYNDEGALVFTVIETGALANKAEVYLTYTELQPGNVAASDIIGGVDRTTGKYKGLELVSRVYPKFALVPGLIAAPGFSHLPEVAAVMVNKSQSINGLFYAQAVVDLPDTILNYTDIPEWKNTHNYTSAHMIACWPKISLGEKKYHLSTQLIGLMNLIDSQNEDIPYVSPSNNNLQMDACINSNGEEINLGLDEANYLNSQGIVTALNWSGGWRAWGNRTAIYPASSDVKDCFIPIRRMFDYLRNDFVTTFWQEVDAPVNRRLIRTIINSYNVRLNGLVAREMLLGGRIEFLDSENPTTDLLNGTIKFHIYITPPLPAETIEGIFEFDVENLNALFNND